MRGGLAIFCLGTVWPSAYPWEVEIAFASLVFLHFLTSSTYPSLFPLLDTQVFLLLLSFFPLPLIHQW